MEFAKGHAKQWLLELTSGMGGDRRGNAIAFAACMPSFMTMDDDFVRETLAALEELIASEDAKNPERRRNPNGDGKLDSLMEISMMRLVQTGFGGGSRDAEKELEPQRWRDAPDGFRFARGEGGARV